MIQDHRVTSIPRSLVAFKPKNSKWDSTGGVFGFLMKHKNSSDRYGGIMLFEIKITGNFHPKGISLRRIKPSIKDQPYVFPRVYFFLTLTI